MASATTAQKRRGTKVGAGYRSRSGTDMPPEVFSHLVETIRALDPVGARWIEAGRPMGGDLYQTFCRLETAYNAARDEADRYRWTPDQSAAWRGVFA